jgi:hypothetical protein
MVDREAFIWEKQMTTSSYVVAEVEDAGDAHCTCGCGWTGSAEDVANIQSCALTPGDPSPVGRCPDCDALVYLDGPLHEVNADSRDSRVTIDLNFFDNNGVLVDGARVEMTREQISDVVDHAAQLMLVYRAGGEIKGILDGLEEALFASGVLEPEQ